jgi:hypothetical protein
MIGCHYNAFTCRCYKRMYFGRLISELFIHYSYQYLRGVHSQPIPLGLNDITPVLWWMGLINETANCTAGGLDAAHRKRQQ